MPWFHEDEEDLFICKRKGEETKIKIGSSDKFPSSCSKCWRNCSIAVIGDDDTVSLMFKKNRG